MILASIICPVSDMAGRLHFVRNWLEEVSSNSGIEVILVHDLTDNQTGEELREMCCSFGNVQLIEGKYGNPGSARNAGLEISLGRWVVFWDSDDEPNVPNFRATLDVMQQSQSDLGIATYAACDEISNIRAKPNRWSHKLEIDFQTLALNPGIWRIVFSRELLEEIRFYPLRMAEDQIFICEALVKARNVKFVDNLNYTYFTGSPHHLTRNFDALQDLLPAFKKTKELLHENEKSNLIQFLSIVAARQLVSGLRYGNRKTRVALLYLMIDTSLIRREFFKGVKIVVQNSIKGAADA